MIRRFVCLMLIAVMPANPGVLFAHVHHAADGSDPHNHSARLHFHLGGHDGHAAAHAANHGATHSHHDGDADCAPGEDDGRLPSTVRPLGDHDANAVYCAETVALARDSAAPTVLAAKCVWGVSCFCVADQSNDRLLRLGPTRGQPASVFDAACPIYLRARSLRI